MLEGPYRMAMVTCEARSDGDVEIIGSGRLSQGEAALLIAEIVKAATEAHKKSGGLFPATGTDVEATVAYVETTAVGLLPGEPTKDHSLLTLHFGSVAIGVAMSNAEARKLGQSLIAASADGLAAH
jgi:hypothetical protein